MKKITKSLLALALLCVAGSVSAQEDEIIDFDGSFYHNWSEVSGTAVDNGEVDGDHLVLGDEVAIGGTIWGDLTGSVPYLNYANITEYSELRFEGTPGATIRLMCNRTTDEGPIYEIKPTFDEEGKLTVKISDLKYLNGGSACDFVCLQSIKVPASWAGGTMAVTITSIKIVKPGDPLSVPKEDLKKAINEGKQQNSFAKTTESFKNLTDAIEAGETALASAKTAEELKAAENAITDAISNLQLIDGYSKLTAAMFKKYSSVDEPGEGTATGCAYNVGSSNDLPYGDGSVGELNWADLSAYDKLIAVVSGDNMPRFCMNRLEQNGQRNDDKASSKFVDINPSQSSWWEVEEYLTKDNNVYTVDLEKLVADYGFARLHSIKGHGYQVKVMITDLLLYTASSIPVTITDAGYATFCSKKAVALETSMEAYAVEFTGTKALLIPVESAVAANVPVILKAAADDYELGIVESGAEPEKNDLQVSNGTVEGDGTIYVLAKGKSGVGFYKLTTGEKVPAGKAYLKIEKSSDSREFIAIDGGSTAIKSVETVKADGAIYNLAGQQVKNAQKGVFIINGKKVIK